MDTWNIYQEGGQAPSIFDRKILFWSHPDDREVWLPKIAHDFRDISAGYSFAFFIRIRPCIR